MGKGNNATGKVRRSGIEIVIKGFIPVDASNPKAQADLLMKAHDATHGNTAAGADLLAMMDNAEVKAKATTREIDAPQPAPAT